MPFTFTKAVAQTLVGTKMPGTIERVGCDPYDYTMPETSEVVSLAYSYQYVPEQPSSIVAARKPR